MAAPDRWAPWSEHVAKAADQDVFNTTAAIGSLIFTGTPHIASRLNIVLDLDVENVGGAADTLIVNLRNNGVPIQLGPVTKVPVVIRLHVSHLFTIDIAGSTAYSLDFTAQVPVTTTYRIYATRSAATLIALPNLHS